MRLEELASSGFRNLVPARVALAPGTTVLVGDNGQGKTSFLEAIGVLATTRSFRRARPAELVRQGEHAFAVSGLLSRGGVGTELSVLHEDGRRSTRVGGVPVELSEYVGRLVVVAITQAHAGIVRGSPQDRRDFLDRGILGKRPSYLRVLASHRRALRQKNAFLRRGGDAGDPALGAQLEAWNERLVEHAAEIVVRRREYVRALAAVLDEAEPRFLPPGERLELRLHDVLERDVRLGQAAEGGTGLDRAAVADALRRRMEELRWRELAARQALVGPHRDELLLGLTGRDVRRFASSGQQRNALLALKMAKVELFRRDLGEAPVLLVDDIDTEIDPTRLGTFLQHAGGRAQTVLTSSKRELFGRMGADTVVHVVARGLLAPA